MAEGGGLLNRCRAFKVLPRVRIPASPPTTTYGVFVWPRLLGFFVLGCDRIESNLAGVEIDLSPRSDALELDSLKEASSDFVLFRSTASGEGRYAARRL